MSHLTKQYLAIKSKEPYITEIMCSLAKEFDVVLADLEYRLKSWHSAVEKATVRTKVNDFFKLENMVRYTMVLPEETYGEMANSIMHSCEKYGIHIYMVKNFWNNPDKGYNGVNVRMICKGIRCELQFHTADSLRVKKEENHPVYEQMRNLPADSPEALLMQDILLGIGRTQKRPNGCESISWEKEEEKVAI